MAHWAEIDENNKVIRVTVGSNNDVDEGYQWLINNLGGRWVKTSYNTRLGIHETGGIPLRLNYAGIGMFYDEEIDGFIFPKPEQFDSWILNKNTGTWEPPIPFPNDGKFYIWNEQNIEWILVE